MNELKITVITVCYNAKHSIVDTVKSVQEQTYSNIEYIVKDGMSTDGTLDLLREIQKTFSFVLYSNKDDGIYDAMNMATGYSTGDYIIFVNAGDKLVNKNVIEHAVLALKKHECPDVFYGNIVLVDNLQNTKYRRYSSICGKKRYYLTGDSICHQAILAKRECISEYPFLLNYKICADREWLLRMIEKHKIFCYENMNICICEVDGFSRQNQQLYEIEAKQCIKMHFRVGFVFYNILCVFKQSKVLLGLMHWLEKKIYMTKNEDEE